MTTDDRLAILVHEVRSPVAALSAVAEALRTADEGDLARAELVDLAVTACKAIERIVADVAMASVVLSAVDVSALVRGTVAAHTVAGSAVEARVEAGLPSAWCDPERMGQALDNLIRNALNHAEGPIVVSTSADETSVVISVADAGPGIPEGDLERIFESGTRLDPGRPGSGLGLAITRAIVAAQGGTVRVDSSANGSTFTITLPVAR